MAIKNTLITNTNSVMYASSGANAITSIIICNYGASLSNLTLFAVPAADVSGTTTSVRHTIISALPIPAGETVSLDQEILDLLQWARAQRTMQLNRLTLAQNNSAMMKALEAIKRAEENFELLEKFVLELKNE